MPGEGQVGWQLLLALGDIVSEPGNTGRRSPSRWRKLGVDHGFKELIASSLRRLMRGKERA